MSLQTITSKTKYDDTVMHSDCIKCTQSKSCYRTIESNRWYWFDNLSNFKVRHLLHGGKSFAFENFSTVIKWPHIFSRTCHWCQWKWNIQPITFRLMCFIGIWFELVEPSRKLSEMFKEMFNQQTLTILNLNYFFQNITVFSVAFISS